MPWMCALFYQTFSKYVVYSRGTSRIPFLSNGHIPVHYPLIPMLHLPHPIGEKMCNMQSILLFVSSQSIACTLHAAPLACLEREKKNYFPSIDLNSHLRHMILVEGHFTKRYSCQICIICFFFYYHQLDEGERKRDNNFTLLYTWHKLWWRPSDGNETRTLNAFSRILTKWWNLDDRAMCYRSRMIRERCRSVDGPNFTFDFSWSVILTLFLLRSSLSPSKNPKVFHNYPHQMTRHFHFRSQPAATAYAHCSLLTAHSL